MSTKKLLMAPSVRRLPSYLQVIRELRQGEGEEGEFISATVIAQELQLDSIQVRKDLAMTGISGMPKKGYPVEALVRAIERFLGWDSDSSADWQGWAISAPLFWAIGAFCSTASTLWPLLT
jgi:redox-sensing transcriptional repressor